MNLTAEVFLWGTRIGIVHQDLSSTYATFEYDRDFIKSGIEPSPIMMPLGKTIYEFPALSDAPFYGLPGLLADSLPDSFGNKIIKSWLSSQKKTFDDFSSIDRLCYAGVRGMGALEYKPVIGDATNVDETINVSEMIRFASKILTQRENVKYDIKDNLAYSQLLQVGTSAGGARAKALIAWNEKTGEVRSGQIDLDKNFDYWLMKFDNVSKNGDHEIEDLPEYTLVEYAYYKMALAAGIKMNECRIYKDGTENHFMTKRFDRVDGKKLHMQTLGALTHINYNVPCLCSYEMAVQYMKKMHITVTEIEQFYRRMVFNVLAVNQDDHVKNISFLMDKKGKWSLSPAYDVTFAYNSENRWLSAHQMSVNGKNKCITYDDLILSGKNMGLKKTKCNTIIDDVKKAIANFKTFASESGLSKKNTDIILRKIKEASGI